MPTYHTYLRRDSSENWKTINPVLGTGEVGLEVEAITSENDKEVLIFPTDHEGTMFALFKVGDGKTPWIDLPYCSGATGKQGRPGEQGERGERGLPGASGSYSLSDAITSDNSWTAASSKAVKIVFNMAQKAHTLAEKAAESSPYTFAYRDVPLQTNEVNALAGSCLVTGCYFIENDVATGVGLPGACHILHFNKENSGWDITQVAVETFSAISITMNSTWKRRYREETGWTAWNTGTTEIPKNIIVTYHGTVASIPFGWVLCDGKNSTPDLRDRFIIGAGGAHLPGDTGGNNNHTHEITVEGHTLSTAEIPRHEHGQRASKSEYGGSDAVYYCRRVGSWKEAASFPSLFLDNHSKDGGSISTTHYASGGAITTTPLGGSQPHTHAVTSTAGDLPPYYALCYIMKQ